MLFSFIFLISLVTRVSSNTETDSDKFYMSLEECSPNTTKCPYSSSIEKIKVFSKGYYSTEWANISASWGDVIEYLSCINTYFTCGYMLNEFQVSNFNHTGVFIGPGINVSSWNDEIANDLKIPDDIKKKISNYYGKTGEEAKLLWWNSTTSLKWTDAETESLTNWTIPYFYKNLKNDFNITIPDNNNRTHIPILSLYLYYHLTKQEIKQFFGSAQFSYWSYYIENLEGGAPYSRKLQSLALSTKDNMCDINYQIGILIDSQITKEQWSIWTYFAKTFMEIGKHSYSLVLIGKEPKIWSGFTNNITQWSNALNDQEIFEESSDQVEMEEGLKTMIDLYISSEENTFQQKVIIMIANNELKSGKFYENTISWGYNIILWGNEKHKDSYKQQWENNRFNIMLFKEYSSWSDKQILFSLHAWVCHQWIHVKVQSKEILTNLKIENYTSPDYFEIEGKAQTKYKVELHVKDPEEALLNVYMSLVNPFPDAHGHKIKHLGWNITQNKPRLVIETEGNSTFFICVFSYSLAYNLTIEECPSQSNDCDIPSNGIYGKTSNSLVRWDDVDFKWEWKSFKNCLENFCRFSDKISFAKYLARGVIPRTNSTYYEMNIPYLDADFFWCYNRVISCIYYEQNNGIMIGHPIKRVSTIWIKDNPINYRLGNNIPFIIINKWIPFRIGPTQDWSNKWKAAIQNENTYFNWREIYYIYSTAHESINTQLKKYKFDHFLCPTKFTELDDNLQFILFQSMYDMSWENDFQDLYKAICLTNYTSFFNVQGFKNNNNYQMQNIWYQSLINEEKEKSLISIYMGKSFFYTETAEKFLKVFIDEMCPHGHKVSISFYDNTIDQIVQILHFSKANSKIKDIIINYKNKNKEGEQSSIWDYEKIIKQELDHFSTYDKGIKKVILVIADEHYNNINHSIKKPNSKTNSVFNPKRELQNAGIISLWITSLFPYSRSGDYNKNYMSYYDVFDMENIFTTNNIFQWENDVLYLSKLIKQLVIQVPQTYSIINDYYKNKHSYYEIVNLSKDAHTQYIVINSNKFDIAVSVDYPYPNEYYNNDSWCTIRRYENYMIAEIVLGSTPVSSLFFTLIPTEDVIKTKIKLYYCEEANMYCTGQNKISVLSIAFVVISTFGLILYGFFSCNYAHKKDRKKINIFK